MRILSRLVRLLAVPHVRFPAVAALLLAIMWAVTFKVAERERVQAEAESLQQTRRLMDAYEAHTLRALGDISQTFKLIDYAYSEVGVEGTLARLQRRNLLLPNIVFTTRVIDSQGRVLASSKEAAAALPVRADMLSRHAARQETVVSLPHLAPGNPEPVIEVSRRIGEDTGRWYVVEVTMPAGYLVSDYDEGRLGKQGVLAILGEDDVFRVRRTGAVSRSGEHGSYHELVEALQRVPENTALLARAWDGQARYVAARPVYGYPLAVVVALSRDERLSATAAASRAMMAEVGVASAVVVAVTGFLVWVSRRLALLRRREDEVRRAHAAQIEHLAYHDALTLLPNRALFKRTLQRQLAGADLSRAPFALLFMDLDGFKKINDVQGHQAGDELLQQVAQRLTQAVRADDFVARLGGDEFVVILRGLHDEGEVASLAQRLIDTVARPYRLGAGEGRVTASIGVCLCPADGADEDTITRRADEAMYCAKQHGKNKVRFFNRLGALTPA